MITRDGGELKAGEGGGGGWRTLGSERAAGGQDGIIF